MGFRYFGYVRSYDPSRGAGELTLVHEEKRRRFERKHLEDDRWIPQPSENLTCELSFWTNRVKRVRRDPGMHEPHSDSFADMLGFVVGAIVVGAILLEFARIADAAFASAAKASSDTNPEAEEAARRLEVESPRLTSLTKRLDRVVELLESEDDEIAKDQAAMLVSATLEAGIRELARLRGVEVEADAPDGMVAWAIALESNGHIDDDELRGIKHHAWQVRNRVMHGDFASFSHENVVELAAFARSFLNAHSLA